MKRDGAVYAIVLAKDDKGTLPDTVSIPAELMAKSPAITLLGYGSLQTGETKDGQTTIDYSRRCASQAAM